MSQPPSGTGVLCDRPPRALSLRDVEVLRLLAAGRSTGQIAASLSVTRNTARTRIRRLHDKLGVRDRAAVARRAQDLGLLGIPRPRRPVG